MSQADEFWFYRPVGAGHLRAAQAVDLAIKRTVPNDPYSPTSIFFQLTTPRSAKSMAQALLELVNKAPHALGFFYDWMDQAPRYGHNVADKMRRGGGGGGGGTGRNQYRTLHQIPAFEPGILIHQTPILPAEIHASLKRDKKSTAQVTVTPILKAPPVGQ